MRDRVVWGLLALTALAAVVRFATLDSQSFSQDEAVTVEIVQKSLGGTLRSVHDGESTPPLYYVLAWLWTRVFGFGEIGVRSLSALAGVATVPACYAAGRLLLTRGAGLLAAAFAAVSPFLVWFGQDARAYALVALLSAVSLAAAARAVKRAEGRAVLAWAVVSVLTVATHYFAGFLVLAEAVWLFLVLPVRRTLYPAFVLLGVSGLLLALLAAAQASHGYVKWIAAIDLRDRLEQTPQQFAFGNGIHNWTVPIVLVVLAVAALLLLGNGRERAAGLVALGLGIATIGAPLALVLAGVDYFYYRNLIAAWPPLAVGVAAALACGRLGRVGPLLGAVLTVASVAVTLRIQEDPALQRADWRAALHELEHAPGQRAVVTWPRWQGALLRVYRPRLSRMATRGAVVRHLFVVGEGDTPTALSIPPGFRAVETRDRDYVSITHFRAAEAVALSPARLSHTAPEQSDLAFYIDVSGSEN